MVFSCFPATHGRWISSFPPPLSEVRRLPPLVAPRHSVGFQSVSQILCSPLPPPSRGLVWDVWAYMEEERRKRRGGSPKSDEEEEEEGRAKRRKNTYLHPSATAERLEPGGRQATVLTTLSILPWRLDHLHLNDTACGGGGQVGQEDMFRDEI